MLPTLDTLFSLQQPHPSTSTNNGFRESQADWGSEWLRQKRVGSAQWKAKAVVLRESLVFDPWDISVFEPSYAGISKIIKVINIIIIIIIIIITVGSHINSECFVWGNNKSAASFKLMEIDGVSCVTDGRFLVVQVIWLHPQKTNYGYPKWWFGKGGLVPKMVICGIYARFLGCKPDEGWVIESYLKLQIQQKVTKDERCRNDVQFVCFEGRIDWRMKL